MPPARTSEDLRANNRARLLRAVHDGGARRTRSELTRELGLARGTASVLVADLMEAKLLAEAPSARHTRGRPTQIPGPHPAGPVALTVDLREDGWQLAAGELGGDTTTLHTQVHSKRSTQVFTEIADVLIDQLAAFDGRVIGIGMAVAGPVRDGRFIHVPHLAWDELDVSELLQRVPATMRLGNDATLAALAEARRGLLRGAGTALHLHVDFDVGGCLVVAGRPLTGAHGIAGEFGHMRLTGGSGRCMCGASGCWGLEVGANPMLRALGLAAGQGQGRAQAEQILAQAADGASSPAREALAANARALGAGIGALVNAHDPELITLSGFGVDILSLAAPTIQRSYVDALMTFHRTNPPKIEAAALGPAGPQIGAMELVFDEFLTPEGLRGRPSG